MSTRVELIMARAQSAISHWREQRRVKKRDKARRTGDTPEKIAERGNRRDADTGDVAKRAGIIGFLSGGCM